MSWNWKVSGLKKKLPKPEKGFKVTPRPGGWWIIEQENPKRRFRVFQTELQGKLSLLYKGQAFYGELSSDSRTAGASQGSDADLIAQFPGKVRKLLVQVGNQVPEGEPLVLVEAMKMEFTIKAPFSGQVKKILVKEGEQILPGQAFLDLEASHV